VFRVEKGGIVIMATFVLVQGAWLGGWYWKRIRSQLQAAGHDVFTPTLTGLADRSHLLHREISLDTHIHDVVSLIQWEGLTDVVLCGHSYGGAVISGIADRVPERIRSLVYLDAFVLDDGESVAQHVPAEHWNQFVESAKTVGDGFKVPPIPPEVFMVRSAADAEWMRRLATMHPIRCFEQPLKLTGAIEKIKDITFILAAGFVEGSPFPPFYRKAQAKGWRTLTMACGHMVMFDAPEELTKILLQISETRLSQSTA
jgi:pimeloyl-ACP methyl ester carboxylesterase